MGLFAAGAIVSLPFPHSDLSPGKLRPVLLLANAGRDDWIVCQIISNPYAEVTTIALTADQFATGGLRHTSYLRPAKLFTAHESLVVATLGLLKSSALYYARDAVVLVIRGLVT